MLRHWHGVCSSRNPGALLENAVAIFYTTDLQLSVILSPIIWSRPLSSAQGTKVSRFERQARTENMNWPPFRFDSSTNLLYPSKVVFERPPSQLTIFVLRVFATLGLTKLTVHPASGLILEATNLTVLNFFLVRLGPMNEKRLVRVLMCSQVCRSMVY